MWVCCRYLSEIRLKLTIHFDAYEKGKSLSEDPAHQLFKSEFQWSKRKAARTNTISEGENLQHLRFLFIIWLVIFRAPLIQIRGWCLGQTHRLLECLCPKSTEQPNFPTYAISVTHTWLSHVAPDVLEVLGGVMTERILLSSGFLVVLHFRKDSPYLPWAIVFRHWSKESFLGPMSPFGGGTW